MSMLIVQWYISIACSNAMMMIHYKVSDDKSGTLFFVLAPLNDCGCQNTCLVI